ncbi:MAG: adenosine kinase [Ilumatobacteraceae bacterium]
MPPIAEFDVVGIGNALVDVIAHADDSFINSEGLVKGSMTLVETERAMSLYRALGSAVEMSGGSAANTMCGIASFGGRAAYIGKVCDDELGQVFAHDLRAVGIAFHSGAPEGDTPTGRCIIVVTPDAERTMSTYLGVSSLLSSPDIDVAAVAAGTVLYMEGYLYDRPAAKEAFRTAAGAAHAAGRQVSLTLSDSFCVDRHRGDFRNLVADEVDILFGNEDELMSLYEVASFEEAVAAVRADCALAAITRGADGCVVVTADEILAVPAEFVERVLDTTGAGDLFASGFLFGYTNGFDLGECARLGSVAAAEVISHVGARPLIDLRKLI